MASGGRITWNDKAVSDKLLRAPAKADVALTAIIERQSARGERLMKTNAPWTDRTGNARQGLHGATHRERLKLYAVILAHTAAYGIWLEVAHGGKFRIIQPSLVTTGSETMRDVSALFAVMFE